MEIRKIKIEKLKIDERTSQTNKKYYSVGIASEGTWFNQNLFNQDEIDQLKEGAEVELAIYQEEWKGKMYNKFRFPKRIDVLEARVNRMAIRFAELEKKVGS